MIAYYPIYALLWLLSLLPLPIHYAVSDILLYPLMRHLIRYRRKIVRRNLASAFPDKDTRQLLEIEKLFYHQLCDYFVEIVKLFSISKKQMMRRMTFSGLDALRKSYAEGSQLIFVYLGHMGNWEWIASLQYWLPEIHCAQIYHKLYNAVSNRMFLSLRQQFGGECIKMKDTYRRLLELKHEGRNTIVGFISDQQPKWKAIHHFSPFLHHDSAVFVGTEHIAKRLGATVYYARVTRPERGHYHCQFVPVTHSPSDYPDYQLTDHYFQMLEADIKTSPHLWLWSHKRWSRTREEWERRKLQ